MTDIDQVIRPSPAAVVPSLTAKAIWAIQYHLRDKPRFGQRFTHEDVLELGEQGLLKVRGLEPADVANALMWARAEARANPAKPSDDARFEALVSKARGAADPVAEMERIARSMWWNMPAGGLDRRYALDALSGRGD